MTGGEGNTLMLATDILKNTAQVRTSFPIKIKKKQRPQKKCQIKMLPLEI